MLYHGSVVDGLTTIWAKSKSHVSGEPVAYFTLDRVYALVCCRKRTENFVTMGPDKNGKQHYYERFPDQLKVMYAGRDGYLYTSVSEEGLVRTKGNSFESVMDVPVTLFEHVTDVYAKVLKEERAGNVIVHRYADIDPEEQRQMILSIREGWKRGEFAEYSDFVYEHFSPLW
ncbi:MAG: hypothetical protein IJR78_03895 [Clostridia bacterium]|nr:hypothetical protein [Clostridia bacterium]